MSVGDAVCSTTRRSAIAGLAAACTGSTAAVAIAQHAPDPIFAKIEAHAAATLASSEHLTGVFDLEDETPAHLRKWSWSVWNQSPPENCTDVPEWIAAQLAIGEHFRKCNDAYVALLSTMPTTMDGTIALIDYLGSDEFPNEEGRGYTESIIICGASSYDDRCRIAAGEFHGRLAASLRKLAAA